MYIRQGVRVALHFQNHSQTSTQHLIAPMSRAHSWRPKWHSSASQAMQSKQLVSFSMRFEQVSFISSWSKMVKWAFLTSNWDLVDMAHSLIITIDVQIFTNVVNPIVILPCGNDGYPPLMLDFGYDLCLQNDCFTPRLTQHMIWKSFGTSTRGSWFLWFITIFPHRNQSEIFGAFP